MPSKIRLQRISDRIRQELSEMLVKEVADPRLSGISVTDVKVDRELAYADVYVSAVEGHERSKEVLAGLRSAAGFLRSALADRVELRVFPRLRFHWDPTPERADHIERVFAEMKREEEERAGSGGAGEDGAGAGSARPADPDAAEVTTDEAAGYEDELLPEAEDLDEDAPLRDDGGAFEDEDDELAYNDEPVTGEDDAPEADPDAR